VKGTPTRFVFRINTGLRTYTFAAPNEDVLNSWIGALAYVTHTDVDAILASAGAAGSPPPPGLAPAGSALGAIQEGVASRASAAPTSSGSFDGAIVDTFVDAVVFDDDGSLPAAGTASAPGQVAAQPSVAAAALSSARSN
jgi:hypothetical protein